MKMDCGRRLDEPSVVVSAGAEFSLKRALSTVCIFRFKTTPTENGSELRVGDKRSSTKVICSSTGAINEGKNLKDSKSP